MIEKFKLKENNYLDSLHDCETSFVELSGNKLIFRFNKVGINLLYPDGREIYPYKTLKATYIISADFEDVDYAPAVRQINQNKLLRKSILKDYTLKDFIEFLNRNNFNLRFYSQYFFENKCLLVTELVDSRGWQMGNEFDLELWVDEITYEWDESIKR